LQSVYSVFAMDSFVLIKAVYVNQLRYVQKAESLLKPVSQFWCVLPAIRSRWL